ncbi:MAG: phosphoribosylamine--glycine ligase [Candidatus Methanoplasma sp.]|jgi:phosphoribosylamine--glycine ligase|nr:phosphoribosylamine--glycine ligase [Candidatus Methanoplasma sp.]
MRILTVGGSGREHAAVAALHRSGADIYAVTRNANPGILGLAKEYRIISDDNDVDAVCEFAIEHDVEYAFIGPESPLEAGLVDALENLGVSCAAPSAAAARIETSKTFMRELMARHGIEGNIEFASFSDAEAAAAYLRSMDREVAIKPVGLTGGKGVKIQGEHLNGLDESIAYVREIFRDNIGGGSVIFEEKLVGEEFTQMVFADGKRIVPMPLVQDHKRAFEDDTGPNTGGMGSYSDADHLLPFVAAEDRASALAILQKIVDAMAAEGCPYRGPMYGQFMLTATGPKVIEINARFGDPEAMNVLPIMETDFASVIKWMVTGKYKEEVKFKNLATVCKYVVPEGYGVEPITGKQLCVDEEAIRECGAEVFYANVESKEGELYTGKSRSVAVVGIAPTIEEAEARCENGLKHVKGESICVRKDIGKKHLIQRRIDHMKHLRS